jgi:hypothetical protein
MKKLFSLSFFICLVTYSYAQSDWVEKYQTNSPGLKLGLSINFFHDFKKQNYKYFVKPDSFLDEDTTFNLGGMATVVLMVKIPDSRLNIALNVPIVSIIADGVNSYNKILPLGIGGGIAYRLKPCYISLMVNLTQADKMKRESLASVPFPTAQYGVPAGAEISRDIIKRYMVQETRLYGSIGFVFTFDSIKDLAK